MLFFCNQIAAQDCSTDSVATVEKQKTSEENLSLTLFHLSVMMFEPEYDYISDFVYPNTIIAVRENHYFMIDVYTGEERLVENPQEAPQSVANAKKKENDRDKENELWDDDD